MLLTLLLSAVTTLPWAQPPMAPQLHPEIPVTIPQGAIYPVGGSSGVSVFGSCFTVEDHSTVNTITRIYRCMHAQYSQCAATCTFVWGLQRYYWEYSGWCNDQVVFRSDTDVATGDRMYTLMLGTLHDEGPASSEELAVVSEQMAAPRSIAIFNGLEVLTGPTVSGDCVSIDTVPGLPIWDYWCGLNGDGCTIKATYQRGGRRYRVESSSACNMSLIMVKTKIWIPPVFNPDQWTVYGATVSDIGAYP